MQPLFVGDKAPKLLISRYYLAKHKVSIILTVLVNRKETTVGVTIN